MRKQLLVIVIILVVFGLVILSSAGIVEGQKKFGDPYYYLKHQLLFGVIPGFILFFFLSRISYTYWRRLALPILFFALLLMILVFVPQFGITLKNVRSWLHVGSYTFQPAEALKLGLVIYFAAWFSSRNDRVKDWAYGIVPFFAVMGFVGLLLMLQPDLGTLVIVIAIALGVYFVAGIQLKDFLIISIVGAVALAGLIVAEPYRLDRIKSLFDPSNDPRGISYQVNQSMIAIGSGGLLGVGYGQGTQKLGFLPETIGDSIFAVIGEELGLVGTVGTIGLLIALCLTLARIANATTDRFGQLYVVGIMTWVMSQAFVNMAAITGIGPLTGIPLPFISYGGTALAMLLASMGIVMNIAKRQTSR
ncbi:MAG: putative lipid II flippase FtsW [Candidatus Yanofskybacteria bacterium]|nr:putative lipid II flippase FtsW [Candidatus Yanofskybacteria bacterium]